jgi:CBS domain-containing membrane protein
LDYTLNWLRAFVPQRNTVPRHERMRAVAGALIGLLLTAGLSMQLLGTATLPLAPQLPLIAPMGASAVLLFCVPASPLAQPWSVIGGNTISALVGIACAKAIGNPLLAAPLAGSLAILVMFLLRCLHPPSGAVALTTVLGGPAVHAAGFGFAFVPVCLNSTLIVLVALIFNNLTGRRYPHTQQSMLQNVHATRDPVPTARIGFTKEDLDAALARYGQVLDISRDDLEAILLETEAQAYGRRFGVITCGAIMSKDAVTVRPGMPLAEAWTLLRRHGLHALPVLDKAGHVVGVVGQNDFLHHAGPGRLPDPGRTAARPDRPPVRHARRPAGQGGGDHAAPREDGGGGRSDRGTGAPDEQPRLHHIPVVDATPIAELVPLMTNRGLHHI